MNFAMAQNRLYYEIQQEYEQLLQVPVLITLHNCAKVVLCLVVGVMQ